MLFRRQGGDHHEADTATRFTRISNSDAVDEVFGRSWASPVLLFKHDPYCVVSLAAHDEVARLDADISMVDVARDKAVAREVTTRTGVQHESPQVMLLHEGRVVWSAAHWAITTDALAEALADHT